MNRRAQTFSLVHLIEMILGVLVIAIIGVGLVSMIDGTAFIQSFFAKDNAYVLESLHAIPNGDVEYGYLWSAPGYSVRFGKDANGGGVVAVQKTTANMLSVGKETTKAFGTSELTTLTTTTIQPKYYQFSTKGTTTRTISIVSRVNLQSCPSGPTITGIDLPKRGDESNGLSQFMTSALISNIQKERTSDGQGPSIAIVFEVEPNPEMIIYDRVRKDSTPRMACSIEIGTRREGQPIIQDSIANIAPTLLDVDADIIIVVRGDPAKRDQYVNALTKGVLEYWAQTSPGASTAPASAAQTGQTSLNAAVGGVTG